MALSTSFPEPGRSFLVGQLNQSKRRLKPVDKKNLYIFLVDGRINLVEDFDEQVVGEVIRGPDDMDPSAVAFWIWVKNQTLYRVLQGEIPSEFVVHSSFDELEIEVKISPEAVGDFCRLPLPRVVAKSQFGLTVVEFLFEQFVFLGVIHFYGKFVR